MANSDRKGPFFEFNSKRLNHGVNDGLSNTFMLGEQTPKPMVEGAECLVFYLGGIPGVSLGGVDEFVNGRVISDPKDRRILADEVLEGLGYGSLKGESSTNALIPAVQAARQARSNQGWGPWEVNPASILSVIGALQFLSGDPVSDQEDRSNVFAVWLTVGFFETTDRPSSYTWAYLLRGR